MRQQYYMDDGLRNLVDRGRRQIRLSFGSIPDEDLTLFAEIWAHGYICCKLDQIRIEEQITAKQLEAANA